MLKTGTNAPAIEVVDLHGKPWRLQEALTEGPLLLAFSKDDPGAAARVVKAFAKDNEKLVATLVSLGGEVLPGKDLDKVATLPTRDQARAQLLGLLVAPMQQLAAVVAAPGTDLVRVIAAFADKRKGEAGAPA